MNNRFLKTLLTLLLVVTTTFAHADGKVTFEASSPLTVAVGEMFRVEFSLNAEESPDNDSFRAPAFEGFNVLAGPSVSRGTSMQITNGSMSRSVNVAYTYVLQAPAAGTYTIPAAEISVDETRYRTEQLLIEVVAESDSAADPSAQGAPSEPRGERQQPAQGVAKEDILLRAVVSRTSVYKNEPLHIAYKLYTRVPIVNYGFDAAPSFNGFWSQDLTSNRSTAREGRETYNGRVYDTYVLMEYLLYPQQSGKLVIDPAEITAVAQVVVQSRHVDPFFGRSHEVMNVQQKARSQQLTINVKALPSGAPASFGGAVGEFRMESGEPSGQLAANSAGTFTVKISGTGNLTFIQAPKLTLPASFELYNVKTTESIHTAANGISGYRHFEYPFIARAEGTYEITPIEFTYFNPARSEYVTLRSNPTTLDITPDTHGGSEAPVIQGGRGLSKEEVKLLGEDIRFIKLGAAQLRRHERLFLFSGIYWSLVGAIALLFAATYAALRHRIRELQNVALVRGKRANKVAVQRFRAAKRYMEQEDRHAFYEEMLRALWGYMSDKFNIAVANLTKEGVREELQRHGVAAEEAERFTAIITRCDEAQYSPAASSRMSDVYTEGLDLISRIEAAIKR